MIVKCPQCGTGYSLPENVIADKPKKMRCSRCKNIFTLARRQEEAPAGYEEYTGQQHLPQEFAFLKETKKEPAPPPPEEPASPEEPPFAVFRPSAPPAEGEAPRLSPVPAPAPPPPRPSAPPAAQPEQDPQIASAAVPEAAPAAAPVRDPKDVVAEVLASAAQAAQRPATPATPATPTAPAPTPASPAVQAYAPARASWEDEMPLELSSYAIPYENRHGGAQVFGKIVFVIIVLGLVFTGYVAYRNGWSLSLSTLNDQVAFAFSGKQYEEISDEARDLTVTISSQKVLETTGGKYLVVSGEVENHGFTGLSRIVLAGKLTDNAGETRAQLRAPCGKVLDEATIARTAKGAISGHYMERDGLYNCVIPYKGSAPFQVVFEDVPADFEPSFVVQVKAVSAQVAE